MVKINTKNVPFEKRGDKIEVKLMDATWQVYYKKEFGLCQLHKLLEELADYGIELEIKRKPKDRSWFG